MILNVELWYGGPGFIKTADITGICATSIGSVDGSAILTRGGEKVLVKMDPEDLVALLAERDATWGADNWLVAQGDA